MRSAYPLKDCNSVMSPRSPGSAESPPASLENYILSRKIGQGTYASVRLGVHKPTRQQVAIKTYEKYRLNDPKKKNCVKNEIRVLRKLNHPHTIKLVEIINSAKQVSLVMEYASSVSLHAFLKKKPGRRLDEAEARHIFQQVVEAVAYCHSKDVAHRDIKLDNILIDKDREVKLIDFGFAYTANDPVRSFCGTPSYMAPEIVTSREHKGSHTDVWALGVLLYVLLSGTFPFKGASERDLFKKISRGEYTFPPHLSTPACSLIRRMLAVVPSDRPSASALLDHEWLH